MQKCGLELTPSQSVGGNQRGGGGAQVSDRLRGLGLGEGHGRQQLGGSHGGGNTLGGDHLE